MEQITTYNDKTKWYEYAILLFIILWSGGGFTYGLFLEWMLYMMPIVGIIFFQRDYKLSNSTILLIGVVLSVHFLQMVNFGGAIINLIKPTCLLLVCAIFAKIICCIFRFSLFHLTGLLGIVGNLLVSIGTILSSVNCITISSFRLG